MDGVRAPAASAASLKFEKTELEKLQDWVESEKRKGLVDVKFFPGNTSDATVEAFAKDANDMLHAKTVPITDID